MVEDKQLVNCTIAIAMEPIIQCMIAVPRGGYILHIVYKYKWMFISAMEHFIFYRMKIFVPLQEWKNIHYLFYITAK